MGVTGSRPARRPKTFSLAATSRRAEQGQLLRHVRRTRQHRRALGGVDAWRRGREMGAAARNQRCGGETRRSAWRSSPRSGPQRRRTPVAHRQADDMLDVGAGGIGELAPAARARRRRRAAERAPKPRRSSDEAPPWQRGPAGRRGGAERKERREDVMGRLSKLRAQATSRCRDSRVRGEAQRLCQPDRVMQRRATPGAHRFARVRALTRRGTRDGPRRSRKQVLRQRPSSQ